MLTPNFDPSLAKHKDKYIRPWLRGCMAINGRQLIMDVGSARAQRHLEPVNEAV